MKTFPLLVLAVLFAAAHPASAQIKFTAKDWAKLQTYDVRTLSKGFEKHVGEIVAVKFNFRGKDIHHMKPNWYEGSLWQPDPNGKKGFSDVRINVAKKDLEAFKAITTNSTSTEEMTLYGKVSHDLNPNYYFVNIIGGKTATDSSGNVTVTW